MSVDVERDGRYIDIFVCNGNRGEEEILIKFLSKARVLVLRVLTDLKQFNRNNGPSLDWCRSRRGEEGDWRGDTRKKDSHYRVTTFKVLQSMDDVTYNYILDRAGNVKVSDEKFIVSVCVANELLFTEQ